MIRHRHLYHELKLAFFILVRMVIAQALLTSEDFGKLQEIGILTCSNRTSQSRVVFESELSNLDSIPSNTVK